MRNVLALVVIGYECIKLVFNTTLLIPLIIYDGLVSWINKKFAELFHDF